MRIGLVDVDGKGRFPNLAQMKIAAYHKSRGDYVEWANPLFGEYDRVYQSKVFKFSEDYPYDFHCEVIKGGTGYDYRTKLPQEIDDMQPDYSIYPYIDNKTAYGFLTRGCPNKCKWCIVPLKEGAVQPYRDVDEIAINGRTHLILMDNNILASSYGLSQIEKIGDKGYRVDFNQALGARLVTDTAARLLARVNFLCEIKFGCDTPAQVGHCVEAMHKIDGYRKTPAHYLMYTMLHGDMQECYNRVTFWKDYPKVRIFAQPYRDFNNPCQVIPQWQRDMARWAGRRELYAVTDFMEFSPRKGFICNEYFK